MSELHPTIARALAPLTDRRSKTAPAIGDIALTIDASGKSTMVDFEIVDTITYGAEGAISVNDAGHSDKTTFYFYRPSLIEVALSVILKRNLALVAADLFAARAQNGRNRVSFLSVGETALFRDGHRPAHFTVDRTDTVQARRDDRVLRGYNKEDERLVAVCTL